jgi:predicted TIM-barrel fold metal-dependent hydrolase
MRMMTCAAVLAVTSLVCPSGAAGQDAKTRFKIDSHYHYRNDPDFVRKTVEIYGKYNTMVCVLTPIEAVQTMQDAMAKYPDTIVAYGSIGLDDPEALKKIDRFRQAGFKGIGELTRPKRDFNDPAYFRIYEHIQKLGMHALFHTGIVARRSPDQPAGTGMAKMRPAFLDEIARRFPRMTMQGAHLGNPWYDEAAEASRWNPNLLFDITGSSLIKKKDRPEFWGEILWWRPSLETMHSPSKGEHAFEKIIFGTDEGPDGLEANIERFDAFLTANRIPEEIQAKCWAGTMAKILGVSMRK